MGVQYTDCSIFKNPSRDNYLIYFFFLNYEKFVVNVKSIPVKSFIVYCMDTF